MEPLFPFESTAAKPVPTADGPCGVDAHMLSAASSAQLSIGKHGVKLKQLLPSLAPDHTYLAITRGACSFHQMIEHVVGLIGPCDVWITSWGISQEPLNSILQLHRAGSIRRLRCLFDSRIREECPQAYQLTLLSNADIKLGKNHSKIAVMLNADASVVISASANLTNNPRMESYVLITHRSTVIDASSLIDQVMADAQPFNTL